MTIAWYRRAVAVAATLSVSLAAPAWAEPALAGAAVVVWPLEAATSDGRRLSLETQGPLVDALKAASSLGTVSLGLPPDQRAPDKVVQAGRSYDADLLVGGNVVVAGGRTTVTLTVQDTVSGRVLWAESASGPADQAVALVQELAGRFLRRWESGRLKPDVVALGQGPGALRLETVPTGATIAVDGQTVGKAPILVRGLAEGEHQVEAVLREEVAIDTLQIVTNPPGLRLQVNGRPPAVSPVSLNDLPAGDHAVTILGETPPRRIGLNVLTSPAGALVSWDGRQLGEAPLTYTVREGEARLGTHTLSVVGRPLFGAATTVTVAGAARTERQLTLDRFAKIIVTAMPDDAQVTLDGTPMGQVPLSLHVRAGDHEVGVFRTTFQPQYRRVTVEAGDVADLAVELAPAHQGDGTVMPMPTGEVVSGLHLTPFLLGFGRSREGRAMSWVGTSVSYGWPDAGTIYGYPVGVAVGGALSRADGDATAVWASGGAKMQVLRQGDTWPVSASVGLWAQGPGEPTWQGFVALSRQAGDFTFHLGLGSGGLSINAHYHRWANWIVGGAAYLDYGALHAVGAGATPFFGVRAGYVL